MATDPGIAIEAGSSRPWADPLGAPQPSLLHLLHLASPALPIGAYAYSQGLETAVQTRGVTDADALESWLVGLLLQVQTYVDVPMLGRLYAAWERGSEPEAEQLEIERLNERLLAQRESRELQQEDAGLGRSLARLLRDLGVARAGSLLESELVTLASSFALAAVHWRIHAAHACAGYLFAWLEGQVAAATRLVPLGQTAAQRALLGTLEHVPRAVETGLALPDAELGASAPGLALYSAEHETLYTRLFRS